MKFLNFNRVLCLIPHPDDAEYSMSGIVLKYPDTHFDLYCMSMGGGSDTTTGQGRQWEMLSAWKDLSLSNVNVLFSECRYLSSMAVDGWVSDIETKLLTPFNYDCILTPSELDSHQDHVFVASLAAPLARSKPYSIIQYRSPSTLDTWIPNLHVPIDDVYDTKKNMLKAFTSQAGKGYFKESVLDGFHTNFQCMKKGLGFVESYKIITYHV